MNASRESLLTACEISSVHVLPCLMHYNSLPLLVTLPINIGSVEHPMNLDHSIL